MKPNAKTFTTYGLVEAITWSLPVEDRDKARIIRTACRAVIPGTDKTRRVSIRQFKAGLSAAYKGRPPLPANVIVRSALENDACWKDTAKFLESSEVTVIHAGGAR